MTAKASDTKSNIMKLLIQKAQMLHKMGGTQSSKTWVHSINNLVTRRKQQASGQTTHQHQLATARRTGKTSLRQKPRTETTKPCANDTSQHLPRQPRLLENVRHRNTGSSAHVADEKVTTQRSPSAEPCNHTSSRKLGRTHALRARALLHFSPHGALCECGGSRDG